MTALVTPTFDVINPATGAVVGQAPMCNAEHVRRAIDAATAAFVTWRHALAGTKAKILREAARRMEQDLHGLAALITSESGKPLPEARGEVRYTAAYFAWFAGEAERLYGELVPSPNPDQQIAVVREPVGVCALVSPWNFPLAMPGRKIAAALAAGCTAVVKPAETTPLSMIALAALLADAGLPPGVLEVVTGDAQTIGDVLLAPDNGLAKVSFTGSTGVGISIAERAAKSLKRVSLELGGNAPFLVFEDADLDDAVAGFMAAKFRNAGQTCVAPNRLLIAAPVYEPCLAKLASRIGDLVVGDGQDPGTTIGPLISQEAVARIAGWVGEAIAAGASLRCGELPSTPGARFLSPMVVERVPADQALWQREIFGPVIAAMPFSSDDQAIALANATDAGLCAYAYTTSASRQRRLARELQAGMIGINESGVSNPHAPFGGIKLSGYGREGSRHGLDDYTHLKYIATTLSSRHP